MVVRRLLVGTRPVERKASGGCIRKIYFIYMLKNRFRKL
jgi:hypothetical protein